MIYVLSGGQKAFAVISVTYPAGSVCTCTDGSKTLKLKDTSGQGFFLIPYAAAWTVTATDGSGKSKSQSVSITADGQSVSVTLNYQLILFDGAVVEPWTVIQANPTATISDTIYLYAKGTSMVVSSVRTTNKIDVSGYSTLKYSVTENVVPKNSFMCVTSSTAAPINADTSNTVTSDVVTYGKPNGTGTYEVDVSEVTGSYYVSLAVGHYAGSGFRISKVWLE